MQQKFLITPFLAPGQFTTENKAIFGPNQRFFLGKNLTGRGSKIIKILSESVLFVLKNISEYLSFSVEEKFEAVSVG